MRQGWQSWGGGGLASAAQTPSYLCCPETDLFLPGIQAWAQAGAGDLIWFWKSV